MFLYYEITVIKLKQTVLSLLTKFCFCLMTFFNVYAFPLLLNLEHFIIIKSNTKKITYFINNNTNIFKKSEIIMNNTTYYHENSLIKILYK